MKQIFYIFFLFIAISPAIAQYDTVKIPYKNTNDFLHQFDVYRDGYYLAYDEFKRKEVMQFYKNGKADTTWRWNPYSGELSYFSYAIDSVFVYKKFLSQEVFIHEGIYAYGQIPDGKIKFTSPKVNFEKIIYYDMGIKQGPFRYKSDTTNPYCYTEIGNYSNDERDGLWMKFKNGNKISEGNYITRFTKLPSGALRPVIEDFKKGYMYKNTIELPLKNGAWYQWNEDGKLKGINNYVNGVQEGRATVYKGNDTIVNNYIKGTCLKPGEEYHEPKNLPGYCIIKPDKLNPIAIAGNGNNILVEEYTFMLYYINKDTIISDSAGNICFLKGSMKVEGDPGFGGNIDKNSISPEGNRIILSQLIRNNDMSDYPEEYAKMSYVYDLVSGKILYILPRLYKPVFVTDGKYIIGKLNYPEDYSLLNTSNIYAIYNTCDGSLVKYIPPFEDESHILNGSKDSIYLYSIDKNVVTIHELLSQRIVSKYSINIDLSDFEVYNYYKAVCSGDGRFIALELFTQKLLIRTYYVFIFDRKKNKVIYQNKSLLDFNPLFSDDSKNIIIKILKANILSFKSYSIIYKLESMQCVKTTKRQHGQIILNSDFNQSKDYYAELTQEKYILYIYPELKKNCEIKINNVKKDAYTYYIPLFDEKTQKVFGGDGSGMWVYDLNKKMTIRK